MSEIQKKWRCEKCFGLYDTREKAVECAASHVHEEVWVMCRTMLCMGAMELHQNGGVGAERMYRVMEPVREAWLALMRVYLTMDQEAVLRMMKDVRDRFNDMGCFEKEYRV